MAIMFFGLLKDWTLIANTDPLGDLGVNETFTAGDFPVTVKQVRGGNGVFSGTGFIVVPYPNPSALADGSLVINN